MDEVPPGSIVITPKEFYDGVRDDIAEIKSAVQPLADIKTQVDLQELRIVRLERVAWVALGFALASGGVDLLGYLT